MSTSRYLEYLYGNVFFFFFFLKKKNEKLALLLKRLSTSQVMAIIARCIPAPDATTIDHAATLFFKSFGCRIHRKYDPKERLENFVQYSI